MSGKIVAIELENFQGHRHSILHLHPGVNVIRGESHSGKTSIIRALRWAILNRPSGDAFKNWDAQKKDPLASTIEFDSGEFVKRVKDGENRYETVEGDFVALRSDVPEEVHKALHLSEINLQTQHEGFFLLQKSGGEVAKELNEAVGLGVIDQLFSNLDSILRKERARAKDLGEELEELKGRVKELEGAEKWKEFADKLAKKVEELEGKRSKVKELLNLLDHITVQTNDKKEVERWLKVEEEVKKIEKKVMETEARRMVVRTLGMMVEKFAENKKSLIEINSWLEVEELCNKLYVDCSVLDKKQRDFFKFKGLMKDAKEAQTRFDTASLKLSSNESAYHSIYDTLKVCPTCGRPMK